MSVCLSAKSSCIVSLIQNHFNHFKCDDYGHLTSWTQQCIRHADVLLVFADSRESPAVTGFEERVEAASIRVTKELVLCHTENTR